MSGLVSGGIPFGFGMATRQTTLGIVSVLTGAVFSCCAGIPVAFLFCGLIVLMAWVTKINEMGRPIREPSPADCDDTKDAYRRGLPQFGSPPRPDGGPPRYAEPVEDDQPPREEDRPRWRAYDDGERRRDERRDRDW